MNQKIKIPQKEVRSQNFTVRFSKSEREKLDKFCIKKKTNLAEFIRFSTRTVMERAK